MIHLRTKAHFFTKTSTIHERNYLWPTLSNIGSIIVPIFFITYTTPLKKQKKLEQKDHLDDFQSFYKGL